MKWHRVRFHADYSDSRPVKWPPLGPFWETGFAADESYSTVVAYFPEGQTSKLSDYWPEATDIDWHSVDETPVYTDRFLCPDYWDASTNTFKQ